MLMSPNLRDDVQYIKGVGPSLRTRLNRLGIYTARDLLYHFPRDYEDRRTVRRLKDVEEGQKALFRFRVVDQSTFYYNGKHHPKIRVADGSGEALLYCFNRQFLTDVLQPGTEFLLSGAYARRKNSFVFSQFDCSMKNSKEELRIVPLYPLTSGVSQNTMRKLTWTAVRTYGHLIEDETPEFIKKGYKLGNNEELFRQIHHPESMDSLRRAKEAISYKEFFKFQIIAALSRARKQHMEKTRAPSLRGLKRAFLSTLVFDLTGAQARVLEEVAHDMRQPVPMNRLLQGDVGCGKTVVALIAALEAVDAGGQAAFMAPTETLARQHFHTISQWLEKIPVRVAFLSGSVKGAQRNAVLPGVKSGEVDILVGTHALYSEDVNFKNLSFVVIDEQHKFGVLQRGSLRVKGKSPDCIVMSATPIPRTLSMTLYGDLDVSIIDELPSGRAAIHTEIVKQAKIAVVYEKVREQIGEGHQAYFIYPLIEESSSVDLKNAVQSYERLKELFSDFRVGILHGRMSEEEKLRSMEEFASGDLSILVSTSVVEVGVDVSNATVMVIEQAERFGLSSIHQLRGRIGRSRYESFCYLVPDRSTGRDAFDRLRILENTTDGFEIAERDLRMRGPGEILGKRQSGVPSFIIEGFEVNTKLIYRAHSDARKLVNGEIGSEEERKEYFQRFTRSDAYGDAILYFGG
jgi:ATP-dependent DNA helicase RecG